MRAYLTILATAAALTVVVTSFASWKLDPYAIAHPLAGRVFVQPNDRASKTAFLAKDCVVGKLLQEQIRDECLRADIKLQLDIVSFFDIHFERPAEVLADQCASCASRLDRGVEVLIHN